MKTLLIPPVGERDPFKMFQSKEIFSEKDVKGKDSVLILYGGEDIGTSIYNEKPNRTVYQFKPSHRDVLEMAMVKAAIQNDIPIIGICRGAQLLCCMAGGSLAQHIDGHGHTHDVTLHDEGNTIIKCNSSHHQMMLPPSSARVLATSAGTTGMDQNNQLVYHEQVNEVVWFPTIQALGIQPHPEWDNCPKDFFDYCIRKIKEYIV